MVEEYIPNEADRDSPEIEPATPPVSAAPQPFWTRGRRAVFLFFAVAVIAVVVGAYILGSLHSGSGVDSTVVTERDRLRTELESEKRAHGEERSARIKAEQRALGALVSDAERKVTELETQLAAAQTSLRTAERGTDRTAIDDAQRQVGDLETQLTAARAEYESAVKRAGIVASSSMTSTLNNEFTELRRDPKTTVLLANGVLAYRPGEGGPSTVGSFLGGTVADPSASATGGPPSATWATLLSKEQKRIARANGFDPDALDATQLRALRIALDKAEVEKAKAEAEAKADAAEAKLKQLERQLKAKARATAPPPAPPSGAPTS
ncbi:MAG: hypothetical protein Q7S23_00270 [bacterium]|nr:hypothetical protein [bacterium]